MRRAWGAATVLGVMALWASLGSSATGADTCLRDTSVCPPWPGYVRVSLGAGVTPTSLPKDEYAPVAWGLLGKFGKADGGHPPALRELELDIDKDVKVNAEGYPACGARQLEERSSKVAMKACRDALLGEGKAHIEVASAEGPPVLFPSRLLVFNGGHDNAGTRLLVHAFVTEPAPAGIVTSVTLQKRGSGLHTVSRIPPIAGGLGSIVDFEFEVGATYSHRGRRLGYFEARCPDGAFKANVEKILFKNEAQTPGEGASTQLKGALAVPCTPKG